MTIIPFPNNFDSYFQNAMNEIAVGNYEDAFDLIDRALKIQMDDDVFHIAVELLQNLNQPEKALALFSEHKKDLYTSTATEELDLMFITLLVDTGDFSEAEKQIHQRWLLLKNNPESDYVDSVLNHYLERITDEKKRQKESEIAEIFTQNQHILTKPYFYQVNFVKSLNILSNQDFESIVRPLLVSDAIHPLIKTEIITILAERGFETNFPVSKHNVNESVFPLSLPRPDYSPFYLEGKSVIERVMGDNIVQMQSYLEVLFLHTLYFYPLENRVFNDATRWLGAIQHPGKDTPYDFFITEVEKGLDLLT